MLCGCRVLGVGEKLVMVFLVNIKVIKWGLYGPQKSDGGYHLLKWWGFSVNMHMRSFLVMGFRENQKVSGYTYRHILTNLEIWRVTFQ